MGDTIGISLKLTNTSDETRTVNGLLALASMYYTGVVFKTVKKTEIKDVVLGPKSGNDYINWQSNIRKPNRTTDFLSRYLDEITR